MWLLYLGLYMNYAIVIDTPGLPISVNLEVPKGEKPTHSTLIFGYKTEADCSAAREAAKKHFDVQGRCVKAE